MRIRGKSDIEAQDILFYNCVASVAKDVSKRIADELTPTFIVQEAMNYFSDKEEYEVSQVIKKFYDENPSFFINVSRAEWFGTMRVIKKSEKK
ncbi:MAG: hypothetical protein AABY15_05460 [Nanoarchaeota archaeon]